ncbi:molybdopterin converting factor subunit 1 [Rehaibacterium terrae]|jgi:molybdopterin synthase sulfur carrier subunit|uniref:Molybdopterin synthase sulfur carrier subunit n=1 Tax=Rehaibacterium terrae TaxID=1341696 RepID=A0A7W8DDP4_9GAMM|nr:molybdopterin converting factor subunit 1 [Rehaibacterium terrae]MBB5015256.1 molybdopterin synthase sulfur carrier subunit [Rehaibacterium terrae]
MKVTVLYFASLRDAAGCESEQVETAATGLRELYAALRARHGFAFPAERLRVAVDAAFVGWDAPLRDGAEIAFIPPVSGG